MKLGIAISLPHTTAEEWGRKNKQLGLSSVVFPCSYRDEISKIDAYVSACRDFDLRIAEVGSWCNVMVKDAAEREANIAKCIHQLELAEYIKADCCVNISGAMGDIWDGPYVENLTEATYEKVVSTTQKIIDAVNPQVTSYTLEPMPWMYPHTPENYLQLLQDVDRSGFGVHMDIVNMISDPVKYLYNAEFTKKAMELLGKYIKSCHIKDVLLQSQLTVQLKEVPCGEGGFDLKNYITLIDRISPDMPVIIEHLSRVEEYIKAVEYIKSLQEESQHE